MTCQIELYQFKITYKNFKSDVKVLVHLVVHSLAVQLHVGPVATEDTALVLTTQCFKTLKQFDLSRNKTFSDSGECILFKAFIEQYFTCV